MQNHKDLESIKKIIKYTVQVQNKVIKVPEYNKKKQQKTSKKIRVTKKLLSLMRNQTCLK